MTMLPYFYDWERPFRQMERDFFRDDWYKYSPHQLMQREFGNFKPWNSVFRNWDNWDSMFEPMNRLMSSMNQLSIDEGSRITSDDNKFQINVDVQHFAPEEITVKVQNQNIVVEGKHEEKKDQHGYVSRQFVRRYTLPDGCLPDTVESKLSSDGVLTVTAPKMLALPSTGEKIVPITHTGPVKKMLGSPEKSNQK